MNDKTCTVNDFITVGKDIAESAFEFLNTTIVKENCQTSSSVIQELKEKYATAKNEGEEYDSASNSSDENPNRIQIEEMLMSAQEESKCHSLRVRKRS